MALSRVLSLGVGLAIMVLVPAANGQTVNSGSFPAGTITAAGVRYKGQNTGNEIYLGVDDLGVGGNRVEMAYTWTDTTYTVTFAFDATNNKITASITSPAASLEYDFDDKLSPICPTQDWDVMQFQVRDNRNNGGLSFNNVMLGANALGSFTGSVDVAGTPGFQYWNVTNFDFSQSFTLTGQLVVQGWALSNPNESLKLEINVGCMPKSLGQSCTAGSECASGNCIDTVCCDTQCPGPASRCDLAGLEGICSLVPIDTPAASGVGLGIAVAALIGVAAVSLARRKAA